MYLQGPGVSPKFIDTAIPDILPCKINTMCGISLLVKGDPLQRQVYKCPCVLITTESDFDIPECYEGQMFMITYRNCIW